MLLDLFDYFWNTYRDFFRDYDCIDDYTMIYITGNHVLHLDIIRHRWDFVDFKPFDDMVKESDILMKELFGNITRINAKEYEYRRVLIEYQLTEEMKNAIYVLSKMNNYEVF